MSARPHFVLANADAGSTERAAVGVAVARLAEYAPVRLCWTEHADDFADAVRDDGADDQIVIAGGDGSIHLALATFDDLGRTQQPVGIVPLGTGNDFARNHRIPLDPRAAADVIVAGMSRALPALELLRGDRRTLVANNVHFGLGATAARRAQALKPFVGRLAYPLSTVFQGVAGSPEHFSVGADGDAIWDGRALAVLALLGPSMGGGVEVVPDDVDAAVATTIDLVIVGPADLRRRVDLVGRVRTGDLEGHDAVRRHDVTSCTIAGPGARFADVDGELLDLDPPAELRLRHDAWRVLLPA